MLKAVGKNIIVKIEQTKKPQGGIELPESYQKNPENGVVLSVGNKTEFGLMEGQKVWFWPNAGKKQNGGEILILREEDILVVEE